MNQDESIIFDKIVKNSSEIDKIKYVLYVNSTGITTKTLSLFMLSYCPIRSTCPTSPIKGQKGLLGAEGQEDTLVIKKYIRDKLNKYLKRLIERKEIERDESSRLYTYKLSKAETTKITNLINIKTLQLKDEELQQRKEIEDADYINSSLTFWKDYAATNSNHGKKEYFINIKTLFAEAPTKTFDILTHFFEKTEEQLEFAKIAYSQLYDITPDIIIQGKIETNSRLKDLRNEKNLISVHCQIDHKTDIIKFVEILKYECPSCGNVATINNKPYFLREKIKPLSHCACGRKGGFRELSFETLNYQKLLISDLDINLLPGEHAIIKNAIIKNGLVDPKHEKKINIGDKVQITGILQDYKEENNDSEVKTYFEVLGLDFLEKVDFDNRISDKEKQKFLELSREEDLISKMSNSLFCKHKGDEIAKILCTLQMFTGYKNKDDRESIHLLLFGEPGTGKSSNFLEKVNLFYPKTSKIAQNNNTSAGLGVASIKNDFLGKNIVELGAVPRANKGFLLIDELNDIHQEVHGNCIEAMESCSVTSNKAGAKGTFPADVKVLATMNPVTHNNSFTEKIGLFEQPMGMSGKFVDRFDFVIPFVEKNKSLISKFQAKKEMVNIKPEFDEFFIKKYMLFSESVDPFIRASVKEQMIKIFSHFGERDLKVSKQSGFRIVRKCENLVRAVARIYLSPTVEPLHVRIAGDIYNDYIDLIENFHDKNFFSKKMLVGNRESVSKSMGDVAEFKSGKVEKV